MMNYLKTVLLLALILSALPSFSDNLLHNPPPSPWKGRKTLTWLDSGNEIRYVDVYIPKSAHKGDKLPIVMWFMGSRCNVRKDYHYLGLCYEDSGLEPYAEKEKFMLVVIDQKHEDGRGWRMLDEKKLDESLVMDVVTYLKKSLPVDNTRIYLWGISAGGKLSQVLASRHSDVFAAVINFSGVIDELGSQFDTDLTACVKGAAIKFPIQHWQTDGDYENLIANMPYMLRLYRDTGHRTEYVFLKSPPGRTLKHEWYPDLYNQRMWDWCKQFSLVDGKTVTKGE
jgi:poly(3-hydroxybutyrate) depolymerase